jgi:alpha,alpha-trehalase
MNTLMWSPKTHSWCDFNMRTGRLNSRFYISNLSPLWMDMTPPKSPKNISSPKSILLKHQHLLEKFECGIPVSMISTDQQWDYNNVWAPNQHSMIMMLMKYDRNAALRLARKFFATVYEGWINSGAIFEKYDVREVGKRGRGGEYEVQSGFGWTNGVVLSLIHVFGDELV